MWDRKTRKKSDPTKISICTIRQVKSNADYRTKATYEAPFVIPEPTDFQSEIKKKKGGGGGYLGRMRSEVLTKKKKAFKKTDTYTSTKRKV